MAAVEDVDAGQLPVGKLRRKNCASARRVGDDNAAVCKTICKHTARRRRCRSHQVETHLCSVVQTVAVDVSRVHCQHGVRRTVNNQSRLNIARARLLDSQTNQRLYRHVTRLLFIEAVEVNVIDLVLVRLKNRLDLSSASRTHVVNDVNVVLEVVNVIDEVQYFPRVVPSMVRRDLHFPFRAPLFL